MSLVQRDHPQASVRLQCRLLGVCRSGLYYQPCPLNPSVDASAYVAEVRRMFRAPACVQGRFGPADERLAVDWQRAGVSLATVLQAILLGSVRKSMNLLDRPDGEPVHSLRYFASLLEEVRAESFPASYWQHLEFNLRRCERIGEIRRAEAAGNACPDLAQADPSGAVRGLSSATGDTRKSWTTATINGIVMCAWAIRKAIAILQQ